MPDEKAIGLIQQYIGAAKRWIAIDKRHHEFHDRYMDGSALKGNIEPKAFFDLNRDFWEQKTAERKETQSLAPTMVELAIRYIVPGGAFLLPDLKEGCDAAMRLLDEVVAEAHRPARERLGKVAAKRAAIKNRYLELSRDSQQYPTQNSIIDVLMKEFEVDAISTVKRYLKQIRAADPDFPGAPGRKIKLITNVLHPTGDPGKRRRRTPEYRR